MPSDVGYMQRILNELANPARLESAIETLIAVVIILAGTRVAYGLAIAVLRRYSGELVTIPNGQIVQFGNLNRGCMRGHRAGRRGSPGRAGPARGRRARQHCGSRAGIGFGDGIIVGGAGVDGCGYW